MSPWMVLSAPRAFFEALRAEAVPAWSTPLAILALTVFVPNLVLTLIGSQQQSFLLTSLMIYVIFLIALIGFSALLSGIGWLRAQEIVAYSDLPFVIGSVAFGIVSLIAPGNVGLPIGSVLMLIALMMGWYRLYIGLEIMSNRAAALRAAIVAPVVAFLITGFSGTLFRLLGLA
jgi:ABC-type xylose transport system permease subunit